MRAAMTPLPALGSFNKTAMAMRVIATEQTHVNGAVLFA